MNRFASIACGLAFGFALAAAPLQAARAEVVSNYTGDPEDLSAIDLRGPVGKPPFFSAFSSIAQLFAATNTRNVLNNFSFWISSPSSAFQYTARIYEFDDVANKVVGGPLYSSAVETAPTAPSGSSYVKKTFNTGAASLQSGKTYAAMLTTDGTSTSRSAVLSVGAFVSSPADGKARTLPIPAGSPPPVTGTWSVGSIGSDNFGFALETQFNNLTAVPVPAAGAGLPMLLGLGLLVVWRRRLATAPAAAA
jgi:hypothetical protein